MDLPAGAAGKAFRLRPPAEAWTRAMAGVAPATYRILMIHADRDRIKALRFSPKPDLIVGLGDDYHEPPGSADQADGVPLVYPGEIGRVLLDVTLVRTANGPILTRYKPVPLQGSKSAPEAMRDKEVLAIIQGHRKTVQELGMLEELANQRTLPNGLRYVGAKACAECHTDENDKCAKHAHSHAWQTLIDAEKREGWPVTHYPECVSCHVVGYGSKSGFVSPQKTPGLLNVTCENCHGPGSAHVAAGDGNVKMPQKATVKVCTECHNFEHSPQFDYSKYWPKIAHGK
ncbi:MAG: hypothetical protein KDC87_08595, partial [Planctomycetes bacterium]|nr:hypothetical protein [Planctomycetota bacterium]